MSDEASRSLVLVGVCGDDSALWGYGRKPPLTHILPHYHVTWRTPAAPPLGDAFDLGTLSSNARRGPARPCLRVLRVFSLDFRRATLQLRPAGSLSWQLLCPALLSDHNVAVDRSVSERHWAFLWRLRATGNAITPSPRDGGSYRVALQQYKSFWQDSTLDLWSGFPGHGLNMASIDE